MRLSNCVEVDVDFDVEVTDFVEDMDAGEIIEALSAMDLTQNQRAELLRLSGYDHLDIVRNEFESGNNGALEVLQDLLCMQHTTTKEQVIEQLKQIL